MRGLGILAAGAVVVALAASGPVAAESVVVGDGPPLTTELKITPKALPRRTVAPAGLRFSARLPVKSASGAPMPAAKEITLLLDRNIELDFAGYPLCESHGLESQPGPSPDLPDGCKQAIIGWGSASYLIRFPDSEPVAESSRLFLVNGGRSGGSWMLFAHTYIRVPVPAMIVSTIKIRPVRSGRYGSEATITIPKVAGGSGSLTHMSFKLDKRFQRDGRKVSVVNAKCPDGKLSLSTTTTFADGSRAHDDSARPCTGRDG